jgi:hypothetical protein
MASTDWISDAYEALRTFRDEKLTELAHRVVNDSDAAFDFVRRGIREVEDIREYEGSFEIPRLFTQIVSYVSNDRLPELARLAVERSELGPSEPASQLIREIALQAPQAFQGLHRQLFDLLWLHPDVQVAAPDDFGGTYIWQAGLDWFDWASPFEGCSQEVVEFLQSKAASPDRLERFKALWCLLESSRPDVLVKTAQALAPLTSEPPLLENRHGIRARCYRKSVEDLLHARGYGLTSEGNLRRLFEPANLALIELDADSQKQPTIWPHPSERIAAADIVGHSSTGGAVAGATCGLCGGPLTMLLELGELPKSLWSRGPSRLAICIDCIEIAQHVLSYRHHVDGSLASLDHADLAIEPEFGRRPPYDAKPLTVVRTNPRWKHSGHMKNQLGGLPEYSQLPEYPKCQSCDREMEFLLQLDCDVGGRTWFAYPSGTAFAFWCAECSISAWIAQP